MRAAGHALLALVLGFFGGWAVATSAFFRYMDAFDIFDRDGGGAMGAIFIVGPFFGVIAAIMLAAIVLVRGLAADRPKPAGWQPPSPESRRLSTFILAALVAAAVYLVGWAFIDLSGPWAPKSAMRSLVYNGVPLAAGLLCAFLVVRARAAPAPSPS
jgi:hypothetical protein